MYRGNVLCVSSDYAVCESWRQHLAAAGFHVIATPDTAEAYDCMSPNRFDVLLLRDDLGKTNRNVLIAHAKNRCLTPILIVGCVDSTPTSAEHQDWIASDCGGDCIVAAVERVMARHAVHSH